MSAEYPLQINGELVQANRLNTTLFTFFGQAAMYDHVFLQLEEDSEGQMAGCYIFKTAQEGLYGKLAQFINTNEFPQILNRNDVPECDQKAWDGRMLRDLGDFVPDGWAEGDGTA